MREFPHPDRALERDDLLDDPIDQARRWLQEAVEADVPLATAAALATADATGRPAVRHVLIRGIDPRGFVFYTHRDSHKGRELAANPRAGLVLFWKELDRQIAITGDVEEVADEESDAYFATRPRDAQLGAWASRQSEVLHERSELEEAVRAFAEEFEGRPVPRPPRWGGYRVVPEAVEFWQGRAFRLHDRFRYARGPEGWRIDRLFP
jgi:pyridoxamine 5'-phosphate oxidase